MINYYNIDRPERHDHRALINTNKRIHIIIGIPILKQCKNESFSYCLNTAKKLLKRYFNPNTWDHITTGLKNNKVIKFKNLSFSCINVLNNKEKTIDFDSLYLELSELNSHINKSEIIILCLSSIYFPYNREFCRLDIVVNIVQNLFKNIPLIIPNYDPPFRNMRYTSYLNAFTNSLPAILKAIDSQEDINMEELPPEPNPPGFGIKVEYGTPAEIEDNEKYNCPSYWKEFDKEAKLRVKNTLKHKKARPKHRDSQATVLKRDKVEDNSPFNPNFKYKSNSAINSYYNAIKRKKDLKENEDKPDG